LTRRQAGERSFHIFYQLVDAHPDRQAMHLTSADNFTYLKATDGYKVRTQSPATLYCLILLAIGSRHRRP
jgi:myosin heavy subunit